MSNRTQATRDLFDAIARVDVEGVRKALAENADPNGVNARGRRPLSEAAHPLWSSATVPASSENSHAICKLLLECGADPDTKAAPPELEPTLLSTAVFSGLSDLTVMLLKAGADPMKKSTRGESALHVAARHRRWKLIPSLIHHGAHVNSCENNKGYTPLQALMEELLRHAHTHGDIFINQDITNTVETLFRYGATPLSCNVVTGLESQRVALVKEFDKWKKYSWAEVHPNLLPRIPLSKLINPHGKATDTLAILCSTGRLPELFRPPLWQGRAREARPYAENILRALPPQYHREYRACLDLTPMMREDLSPSRAARYASSTAEPAHGR